MATYFIMNMLVSVSLTLKNIATNIVLVGDFLVKIGDK